MRPAHITMLIRLKNNDQMGQCSSKVSLKYYLQGTVIRHYPKCLYHLVWTCSESNVQSTRGLQAI